MISFVGIATNIADNGSNAASVMGITPPPGMVAGDLAVIIVHSREVATFSMANAGGQTWNEGGRWTPEVQYAPLGLSSHLFWCKFNGTWSANPQVQSSSAVCNSAALLAFRPTDPANEWAYESGETRSRIYDTSETRTIDSEPFVGGSSGVRVCTWLIDDDKTATMSGAGYVTPGSAQYRNLAGDDITMLLAYKVLTAAGETGSVVKTTAGGSGGGDEGISFARIFYETGGGGETPPEYDDTISEDLDIVSDTFDASVEDPTAPEVIDVVVAEKPFAVHTAEAGETLFDLAIRLYGDIRGVADIIELNPDLDPNADSHFGAAIIYDTSVVYKKEVFVVPIPSAGRPDWKVRSGQTAFDLALQLYGEISGLEKIIPQVGLDDPAAGSQVVAEATDNYLANNLFNRSVVATAD